LPGDGACEPRSGRSGTLSTPLEDYALIGDGRTAALLSRDGSVDWLCWPRYDSDACFAALLGREEHGSWSMRPAEAPEGGSIAVARRYQLDTLVMESDLAGRDGAIRLIDFMPIEQEHSSLIRIVVGLSGETRVRMMLRLRFYYGALPPWTEPTDNGFVAKIGPDQVVLHAPVPVEVHDHASHAVFNVSQGQRLAFVLRYADATAAPPRNLDAEAALAETRTGWRQWIDRFDDSSTRWPEAVRRSLITLKALIDRSTGGLVAAPTTSLPEAPGGSMNWDYRYCWLRDSTFALGALINAGYHDEALKWRDWLLRAIAGSPDKMNIMYRVDGGRDLHERTVEPLPGYRHARPVRVGNLASTQFQLDVWGEVSDSLDLAERAGLPGSRQTDLMRVRMVEHLLSVLDRPGAGMWESRGEPRHYTYSRAMAWVGINCFLSSQAVKIATPDLVARLTDARVRLHAEICREAWNDGLGTFTRYYGGQDLDASLLLLPLVGFLPVGDPRMASTISVIGRELMEGGLIRRTLSNGPDAEGAFIACSCWMADCLGMQGKKTEAEALFERVLELRNDVGLLSEEYNVPGGRLSGNFPQALSHLAVVNTALGLCGRVLQRGGA
jgi:GH15 family glucan-1,4-alpha-glucosidase